MFASFKVIKQEMKLFAKKIGKQPAPPIEVWQGGHIFEKRNSLSFP